MTDKRLVLALAGGVGGGKLARGLIAVLPPEQLAIAVNTADDFVHLGLHISPDIDSVLYALADRNDLERGWGLAGETWNFMAAVEHLGGPTWFKLGDRDLATHVLRAEALAAGSTLSDATGLLARRLGIAHAIVPMSDDPVHSVVDTDEGALDFQDYFVRRQCKPKFHGVKFQGAASAKPSAGFREALNRAHAIVITPSNPFVSIDPILSLPGISDTLRQSQRPVVAVSPIVGGVIEASSTQPPASSPDASIRSCERKMRWSWSIAAKSIPASRTASIPAPMASWMKRLIRRAIFGSMTVVGSKSRTSAAIRTSNADVSKRRTVRVPVTPATRFDQ